MRPDDEATLLDVMNAAKLAGEFVKGMDKPAFLADLKTQSATHHQLLILGEAVKRLSSEFREKHRGLPWRAIAGMRDRLIHQYDAVDLDEVWHTLAHDLPLLIQALEGIMDA